MAKHKEEKTNVMRVLDQKKIPYTAHTYDPESGIDGVSVARSLGQDPASVFKTLVARGASGGYFLFDIPPGAPPGPEKPPPCPRSPGGRHRTRR